MRPPMLHVPELGEDTDAVSHELGLAEASRYTVTGLSAIAAADCLDFAPRSLEIASLRARGCGAREVARGVGRSRWANSRELRRNAATPSARRRLAARGPGPFPSPGPGNWTLRVAAATVFSLAGGPVPLTAVIDCLCTRSAGHRSACLIR